jgi:hypothetical protein
MNTKQARLPSAYKKTAEVVLWVTPFNGDEQGALQRVTLALFLSSTRGHVPGLFRQVDDDKPVEIGNSYLDLSAAIAAEVAAEQQRTPLTTGSFWQNAANNSGK